MPRTLVRRPQGAWKAYLREELVNAFEGNYCAALIADSLEWRTSVEIDRLEAVGTKDAPAWITVSELVLAREMCGMYSVRHIRRVLNWMEESGFIVRSTPQTNQPRNILYHYQQVDTRVGHPEAALPGHLSCPDICPTRTFGGEMSGQTPQNEGALSLKEVKNLNIRVSTPQEALFSEPAKNTEPQCTTPEPPDDGVTRAELPKVIGKAEPQQPRSENYAASWNELVPLAPVRWNPAKDAPLMAKALRDLDFVNGFLLICRKARDIHKARPGEVGWLSFRALFTNGGRGGQQKWKKLLDGEYDWLAKPQQNGHNSHEIHYKLLESLDSE